MKQLFVICAAIGMLSSQPRLGNGLKPATITSAVPASAHTGEIFWISDGCSGGSTLQLCKSDGTSWALVTGSGTMTYPSAGVPQSTGSAWGSSVTLVTNVGTPGTDTNLATEKAVRTAIAAGGGGGCYSSATQMCVQDDFLLQSGNYAGVGSLNWSDISGYPSASWTAAAAVSGHPGLVMTDTGATANTVKGLAMGATLYSTDTFDAVWIAEGFDNTSNNVTNLILRYGLISAPLTPDNGTQSGFYAEVVDGASAAHWFLKACTVGTCDQVDTGVTHAVEYSKIEIKRIDANTVGMIVNGGAVNCITTAASAPATCTGTNTTSATHTPTSLALGYISMVKNTAAVTKRLLIDFCQLSVSGLNR